MPKLSFPLSFLQTRCNREEESKIVIHLKDQINADKSNQTGFFWYNVLQSLQEGFLTMRKGAAGWSRDKKSELSIHERVLEPL